jgi:glycosyltransferase involved in cell wall biosynthesis
MCEQTIVFLASVLPSENWFSADLYLRDVTSALAQFSELSVRPIVPRNPRFEGRISKGFVRHVSYPLLLRQTRPASGVPSVLHVTDHSYGHLCGTGMPTVVTCHELSAYRMRTLPYLQFELWKHRLMGIRKADVLVAISDHAADDFADIVGVSRDRIIVSPLGVDPSFRPFSAEERGSLRRNLFGPQASDYAYVLHVGTNESRKNVATALRAVALLGQQGRPVRLVKVGPRFGGELERLSRDLGVEQTAIFLDYIPPADLIGVYNACDVFLFPSLYEGAGRSLLEAQACGLPCVVANATSLPQMGGEGALYHEPTDFEELADCISRILNDPALRGDLVARGIRNAGQHTWEQHGMGLKQAYDIAMNR